MSLFSLIQPALAALELAPQDLQVADARSLVRRHYPNLSPDRPALVGPLTSAAPCAGLGVLLQQAYPAGHGVTLVSGLGTDQPMKQLTSLDRLDEVGLGEGISLLYVPPLPFPGAVETFQNIVAHLRAPDGCPWDREQTHRSLRQGFQEEAYEVLDALDRGDLDSLVEELGDVLLHILLQAQIASEYGEFRMSDVVHHVYDKIVHRHPHVFDDLAVNGIDEILSNWEALKHQEKAGVLQAPSVLDSIAPVLPALARAQSIQRHVRRLDVLPAEPRQLVDRILKALPGLLNQADGADPGEILGTILFDLSNLARKLGLDAESALREANLGFERRFRAIEEGASSRGTRPTLE